MYTHCKRSLRRHNGGRSMRLVILSASKSTETETMATTVVKITEPVPIQLYGRVILSLENCLLPQERLESTPSSQDGLDKESETELRVLSCEMIQTAGILLKLPQVAMATGQVLFHRFYYSKSLVRYNYEVLAMGCVCLASKIEEAPRRIRDVINVFHHIKQLRNSKQIQPMILDQNYLNLKNQVIKAERRVLKELGFCVHVKHPHKVIVMYLQVLECKSERLTQLSWNYMNDSLRTDVFLRYTPETIACACIYLSARKLQIPLPNKPAWYSIFRVDEQDIRDICHIIIKLYTRPKPNIEKLEKIVDDLKKAQDEAKLKAKGISVTNTPQGAGRFSPNSRSSSPHKTAAEGLLGGGKDDSKGKKNGSPRASNKDQNHVTKNEFSPSSNMSRDRKSGGSHSSKSRSRSRSRKRTPPRGYKGTHKSTSRSRSKSTERKKRRTSKRSRRSRSHSYNRSPHRNHKKSGHREKIKYRSRSRDRNYRDRSRSRSYDKYPPTKSRKEKTRDNGHHRSRSYERSRR